MGNLTRGQVVFWVIFASALVVLAAVVMSYPVQRPVGRAGAFYPDVGVLCPPGFQPKEDGTCKLIPTFGDGLKDQLCKSKGTVYCSLLGRCVLSDNDCKCGGGSFYDPRTKKCVPDWLVSIFGGSGLAYVPPDYGDDFPPGALPGGWPTGGGLGSSRPGGGTVPVVPDPYGYLYGSGPGGGVACTFCDPGGPGVNDQGCLNTCKVGDTCPPPGFKLVPVNQNNNKDRCQTDADCPLGDACLKDCDGNLECRPKGSILSCPAPA